jgi:ABC-type uncharacterized transport system YnjBCD substrate-binding protein
VPSHPPSLPAAAGGKKENWKALVQCIRVLLVLRRYNTIETESIDTNESTGTSEGFQYLKALQPYLYPEPEAPDGLRNLMKHDDIWLMPYWNNDGLSEAQNYHVPFMSNYFPADKMPVRNTPLAVPRSARHKLAALIFMNYALADDTQKTMAEQIRQFPANTSDAVLRNLPPNTFGYTINDITHNIFLSYNSAANLQWIQSLLNIYQHTF